MADLGAIAGSGTVGVTGGDIVVTAAPTELDVGLLLIGQINLTPRFFDDVHIRTKLRQAVVATLEAIIPAEYTVVQNRVHAIRKEALPLVVVVTPLDDSTRNTPGEFDSDAQDIERTTDLRVTVYRTSEESELDDNLDGDARYIEHALSHGVVVDGKAVALDYQGSNLVADGADKSYGGIQLRFTAEMINVADEPTILID